MNTKILGYVLSITAILNIILIEYISLNIIPFLTFILALTYGVYLLSKEDTPVKVLFDKLKTYQDNTKTSSVTTTIESSKTFSGNQKVNYLAIVAAVIAVIAVFLPWVEGSSSASVGGYSASMSTGGVAGIQFGEGILALLIALSGGGMAFKNIKWSFIAGALNILIGIAYIFGWFNSLGGASMNSSYGGMSASSSIDPQYGLFIFILASLLFVISTLKYLKSE